jgi:hypothetical protein
MTDFMGPFILGFLSAFFVRWWQFKREYYHYILKMYIEAIDSLALNSQEYWNSSREDTKSRKNAEIRMLRDEGRSSGLRSILKNRFVKTDSDAFEHKHNQLINTVMGGEFGSSDFSGENSNVAWEGSSQATDVVVFAVKASYEAFQVKGTIRWFCFHAIEKSERYLAKAKNPFK